jgi:Na+-driven multidrug efflux pump
MILGAILNIALDPILIFGLGPIPAMGLNGAALAALLARGAIFVGALHLLRGRLNMVSFNKPNPVELKQSWRDILHVGIPAAGTNAIVPIGTAIITAMIARYGPEAVAGFGVASRIESMTLVFFYALSAIIGPFVGQNLSAGKEARILSALRLCMLFCVGAGLVMAAGLAALSDFLPSLFSSSADVVRIARLFLWIAPISYGAYGMVMVMNASFNGLGYPMPAVGISVGRIIVLYVPLAITGMYFFDAMGIFAAYSVANIISGFVAYEWAKRTVRRQCSQRSADSV